MKNHLLKQKIAKTPVDASVYSFWSPWGDVSNFYPKGELIVLVWKLVISGKSEGALGPLQDIQYNACVTEQQYEQLQIGING